MSDIFTVVDREGGSTMTVSKDADGDFEFLVGGFPYAELVVLRQVDAARLFATVFNEMDGSAQALTRTWMGDR
ncbi:hypothetical protein SEA_MOLLYMUR_49 [Gordonia phage Mollymur]|uniref:Uncharacterized protein n=1 Tax=Gordonia phage Mollymur TaxID=2590895 RepID=A0A4Y6EBR3_9CAUD|nr:hypothetical protein PQB84_gp076 [Gordonia phage Mollymur]QDF15410.1 hypothetical protein SEA_MOLLYMUR_49 [Gordonia phage Mollymur]